MKKILKKPLAAIMTALSLGIGIEKTDAQTNATMQIGFSVSWVNTNEEAYLTGSTNLTSINWPILGGPARTNSFIILAPDPYYMFYRIAVTNGTGLTAATITNVAYTPAMAITIPGASDEWLLATGAADSIGTNNGTLVNSPPFDIFDGHEDMFLNNSRVEFSPGSWQYVSLPGLNNAPMTNFTVCAWICPISYGDSTEGDIFDRANSTTYAQNCLFGINGSSSELQFQISDGHGGYITLTDPTTVSYGVWSYVTATVSYNSTIASANLYTNGVLCVSGSQTMTIDYANALNQTTSIGSYNSGSGNPFNGRIAQVTLYGNTNLTANQINKLYSSDPALSQIVSSPFNAADFQFKDYPNLTVITDSVNTSVTATVTGGEAWVANVGGTTNGSLHLDSGTARIAFTNFPGLDATNGKLTIHFQILPYTYGFPVFQIGIVGTNGYKLSCDNSGFLNLYSYGSGQTNHLISSAAIEISSGVIPGTHEPTNYLQSSDVALEFMGGTNWPILIINGQSVGWSGTWAPPASSGNSYMYWCSDPWESSFLDGNMSLIQINGGDLRPSILYNYYLLTLKGIIPPVQSPPTF